MTESYMLGCSRPSFIRQSNTNNPSRCCHIEKTNNFIAVGSNDGSISVMFLSDRLNKETNLFKIEEAAYRKDAKAGCMDIKFSPCSSMIALGTRDDSIYLYSVKTSMDSVGQGRNSHMKGTCILRAMHRLRGHSSSITHLDWSYDSKLLRSTCSAYELLCFDTKTGKLASKINVADVRWKTNTCILGFEVMGIWPQYSDGTDVNALDVSKDKGVVITANDDEGLVRLFNYPCVVKSAPCKEYSGHSSHVTNARFLPGGDKVVTVGGNDSAVCVWDCALDESIGRKDRFA